MLEIRRPVPSLPSSLRINDSSQIGFHQLASDLPQDRGAIDFLCATREVSREERRMPWRRVEREMPPTPNKHVGKTTTHSAAPAVAELQIFWFFITERWTNVALRCLISHCSYSQYCQNQSVENVFPQVVFFFLFCPAKYFSSDFMSETYTILALCASCISFLFFFFFCDVKYK